MLRLPRIELPSSALLHGKGIIPARLRYLQGLIYPTLSLSGPGASRRAVLHHAASIFSFLYKGALPRWRMDKVTAAATHSASVDQQKRERRNAW